MVKSPISLLQELLIKKGYVPIYDYIGTKSNGIYSQFVYRITYNKFSCDGVGNSKKEAKHNAAVKMLLLLEEKDELSLNNSLSLPVENEVQSSNCFNYVGWLQEYCVQQKLSPQDILYKVVGESGPCDKKSFTIEVSVGLLREKGTAQCKKAAKQEAAKKLLQSLSIDITKLAKGIKNEICCQETLEDNIRKLGVGISECVIDKSTSLMELSKKSQLLYMEHTTNTHKVTMENFLIKDSHFLFEKIYSDKFTYNMREKMQIIRDTYINRKYLIREVKQDIERALRIKLERIIIRSLTKDHIICLRLLSQPKITQFGMGETEDKAESLAMYNVIVTILTFLNIF